MLSKEQRARLTPDELIIAEKWDAEKEQRDAIYAEILAAIDVNATESAYLAMEKLTDSVPSQCEHGRHVLCGCMDCDDLERKLYPECFENCINCGEPINKEELENGRCMSCPEE